MKKRKRKGFTIVELVIAIAIVAVLAAVLIPTFVSLIEQANNSAYWQERADQLIADFAAKEDNALNCPTQITSIIIIPETVETIGDSAFDRTGLIVVVILSKVTIFGQSTSYYCEQLTTIAIPTSVKTIEEAAFDRCSKLNTINYRGSESDWKRRSALHVFQ